MTSLSLPTRTFELVSPSLPTANENSSSFVECLSLLGMRRWQVDSAPREKTISEENSAFLFHTARYKRGLIL